MLQMVHPMSHDSVRLRTDRELKLSTRCAECAAIFLEAISAYHNRRSPRPHSTKKFIVALK
jgi:hypothetical protein